MKNVNNTVIKLQQSKSMSNRWMIQFDITESREKNSNNS